MLTGASYDISSPELLERLNWKNFDTRFEFNKAVLVYSILENGDAPCLSQQFSARNNNCYVICHDDGQQTNEDCKSFIKTSFLYNMAANSPSITQHVSLLIQYHVTSRLIRHIMFILNTPT